MIETVVIQATPFCNLNCSYCYLPFRLNTKRITPEVLSQIFRQVLQSRFVSDEITVMWHAGEPLILPIKFYREAFALQQQWNTSDKVKIVNAMQTNATLITEEWCEFFKEQNLRVCLSLDGPEHLHDTHRVDIAKRGSFQRAMRGARLLRDSGIDFGVIAVITQETVQHPDDFWNFFAELRPSRLGLNPEEYGGANLHASLRSQEGIQQYRAFFKRILELSAQADPPIVIREVEEHLSSIINGPSSRRFPTNVPLTYLNFDYTGNISSFAPELLSSHLPSPQDFIFGNVLHDTLEDMLMHPRFSEVSAQIEQGVKLCRETCDYFAFCGGGCPSNKLFENGTFASTETNACQLHVKQPVDVLLEHLEKALAIPAL